MSETEDGASVDKIDLSEIAKTGKAAPLFPFACRVFRALSAQIGQRTATSAIAIGVSHSMSAVAAFERVKLWEQSGLVTLDFGSDERSALTLSGITFNFDPAQFTESERVKPAKSEVVLGQVNRKKLMCAILSARKVFSASGAVVGTEIPLDAKRFRDWIGVKQTCSVYERVGVWIELGIVAARKRGPRFLGITFLQDPKDFEKLVASSTQPESPPIAVVQPEPTSRAARPDVRNVVKKPVWPYKEEEEIALVDAVIPALNAAFRALPPGSALKEEVGRALMAAYDTAKAVVKTSIGA